MTIDPDEWDEWLRLFVVAALMADPNNAPSRGTDCTRCRRCGRVLTNPDSIAAGIGTTCRDLEGVAA